MRHDVVVAQRLPEEIPDELRLLAFDAVRRTRSQDGRLKSEILTVEVQERLRQPLGLAICTARTPGRVLTCSQRPFSVSRVHLPAAKLARMETAFAGTVQDVLQQGK